MKVGVTLIGREGDLHLDRGGFAAAVLSDEAAISVAASSSLPAELLPHPAKARLASSTQPLTAVIARRMRVLPVTD
jgi:hypothetical protein